MRSLSWMGMVWVGAWVGVYAAVCAGSARGQAVEKQPARITGKAEAALAPLDELMVSFVAEHEVPGAALAVAKDGRLVYARGFGVADRTTGEAVGPDALFRIASVGKPITAVAVMKLVEEGKLNLEDRAFELLALSPHLEEGKEVDARLKEITVLQLLQHTGGWDRGRSFDPMFRTKQIAGALKHDGPAEVEHVIRYMMGQPLDFGPGEKDVYSNFGYCVLGRVIERASGKTYEDYVRQEIFAPLGIERARIGRTVRAGRLAGEVVYHAWKEGKGMSVVGPAKGPAVEVPTPYGAWYLEAMDAHGGWVASAPDLVRFASALDAGAKRRVLKRETVKRMLERPAHKVDADGPPNAPYYGCGWSVRPVGNAGMNTWHNGRLSGTATLLVRRHDGLTWCVLFNTDADGEGEYLSSVIDPMVHRAVDRVKMWPAYDLWELPAVEKQ